MDSVKEFPGRERERREEKKAYFGGRKKKKRRRKKKGVPKKEVSEKVKFSSSFFFFFFSSDELHHVANGVKFEGQLLRRVNATVRSKEFISPAFSFSLFAWEKEHKC